MVPSKNLGLRLVPRVLTADFDQRVVVLLKFSEMQLVLMVSEINMLPHPPGYTPIMRLLRACYAPVTHLLRTCYGGYAGVT